MGQWEEFLALPIMTRFLLLDELSAKIDQHNEAAKDGEIPHGGGRNR